MADAPDLAAADDHSSSDEETVKGDRDDHISDAYEEELQTLTSPITPTGGSSIKNRYRELVEVEHEAPSDDGYTDAVPVVRVDSPIDSVMSIPDDTPSIQVR
jgi:vacuolar protein sorting-associated protein 8